LWVQVNSAVPVQVPDFYGAALYDSPAKRTRANGILYREPDVAYDSPQAWRTLLETPVQERVSLPLYESMITAAHRGLKKAVSLYGQPDTYGRLLANAVAESGRQSWKAAAVKYRQVYDVATGRGG
jgi:hypothetical protein